jgi:hypothetical protein
MGDPASACGSRAHDYHHDDDNGYATSDASNANDHSRSRLSHREGNATADDTFT